jgi:prokaryotic ubiquitin-like protein Pup
MRSRGDRSSGATLARPVTSVGCVPRDEERTRVSDGGRTQSSKGRQEEPEEQPQGETAEDAKDLLDDVDDLLDEIDDVLEENAEEFVRGYVQKGGQ